MAPKRLPIAVLVLVVCASCARRNDGRVADASAPARTAFDVYPVEELIGVKDPHAFRGKALCQRCHYPDLKLTNAPNALCLECHRFSHRNHPVDVVQKAPAEGLPLLPGGRLACHTCHDPHQKTVLRKEFTDLCTTCHRRH
jgi:predicted CXXCH cytochrome family protein